MRLTPLFTLALPLLPAWPQADVNKMKAELAVKNQELAVAAKEAEALLKQVGLLLRKCKGQQQRVVAAFAVDAH